MKGINRVLAGLALAVFLPLAALAGPVNVNTADAETLSAELQGIGLTKAQAIVEWREANGPFRTWEDLRAVKGIGVRTIEINRENIRFDSGPGEGKD